VSFDSCRVIMSIGTMSARPEATATRTRLRKTFLCSCRALSFSRWDWKIGSPSTLEESLKSSCSSISRLARCRNSESLEPIASARSYEERGVSLTQENVSEAVRNFWREWGLGLPYQDREFACEGLPFKALGELAYVLGESLPMAPVPEGGAYRK
jgi:hypothetical protein